MADNTLAAINDRAIALRAQGRLREAIAAFSEGIVLYPHAAILYNNLAMTLDEMGAPKEALLAYESALSRSPGLTASLVGSASLLLRDGRIDEARGRYESALAADRDSIAAHLGLYELLQIKGDLKAAVEHQRRALKQQRVYSQIAPRQQRSILVLCAPGDWQTNVPVDFIVDRGTTTVYKLFLLDQEQMRGETIPAYDVVFNAIAESDEAMQYLDLARTFANEQTRPLLNAPERVAGVGRRRLQETLAGVDCNVVPVTEVSRAKLRPNAMPYPYPLIVRPVGSHAGHDLDRVASDEELQAYAGRTSAPAYFVSPFFDYARGDGFYRKYRVVYVDGAPFPVHLAISPNWMIHYYNAPMSEHEWMRDEEAGFLADMGSVFSGAVREALEAVAGAVGLEYFGIDCAIGPDGRLLIFEADPAMLVHTTDPIELFPYKHEYIPRIYRAIEAMVDRRKAADT